MRIPLKEWIGGERRPKDRVTLRITLMPLWRARSSFLFLLQKLSECSKAMYQQLGDVIIFVQLDDPSAICPMEQAFQHWHLFPGCNGRQGTNNSKPCHAHHQSIQLHIQKLCTNTIINRLRLILPPCTPPLDTRVGHAHLWFDGWVWFLWHWWILERMIHQHHH